MKPERLRASGPVFIAAILSFLIVPPAARSAGQEIDNTRAALEKWVETQRIISEEKRDFALSRQMLNERVELVEREIESLQAKIGDAQKSITEADEKREELIGENEALKEVSGFLAESVVDLEFSTRGLLPFLPQTIRERVKPLSQRFPEDGKETRLSLGERFQNVVGVLNEVNRFNRDVTVVSEVRDLPGGTSVEVKTMYAGVGHGYYVNGTGDRAGLSIMTSEGWEWEEAGGSAPAISQAIDILNNESPAAFVQLPVAIQSQGRK